MRYDDNITPDEMRLIQALKGKSRMEQDQIIFEYERKNKNDFVRYDSTSTGTVRAITK